MIFKKVIRKIGLELTRYGQFSLYMDYLARESWKGNIKVNLERLTWLE